MKFTKDGRVEVNDADREAMNRILDHLRDLSEKNAVWNKLSDATLEEKWFNDFEHKKK